MRHEIITSPQNPRVQALVRLRAGGARRRRAHILIDGRREIARAAEAGVQLLEVFYCRALLDAEDPEQILAPITGGNVARIEVTQPVFERIGYGDRREGLVATAIRPRATLEAIPVLTAPLIVVLDRVEKPGNLGAILRTAEAAGVDALIAVDSAVDVYGPNVIRASLGSVFSMPPIEANAEETRAWLKRARCRIVAAAPRAKTPYTEIDYTGPTAIVLGSEARGLSAAWGGENILRASLPMRGRVDSLNVSATAAVFFYEALRQRRPPRPPARRP